MLFCRWPETCLPAAGQTEALTGGGGWLTKVGRNTCGGGKSVTHFIQFHFSFKCPKNKTGINTYQWCTYGSYQQ